ncbi:MAG: hypothetical protein JWQ09_3156, partial [Segetibacter sp.]|nr:hypothetical protein [Segetibacter sp.]
NNIYMDKDKNKGLADIQEGEFILNESGTSVSIDVDLPEEENQTDFDGQTKDNSNEEIEEIEETEDK